MQRVSGSCRPSPDRSARGRGARCRRSSRRRGSCPSGASMPKLVPMPISPRKREPSSVASARCRYSSPTAARAETTSPSRSSSSTPSTSIPAGAERTVKRTWPLALCSCGPVKTSPLGMLRLPSELTHVRPATLSVRSVPSASRRSSRASRRRPISALLEGAQAAPRRDRVGLVEEQRAAHEGREVLERHAGLRGQRLGRPQRRAPALLHRRLADRAARTGVAGDAIGVDAGELAHVAGRLDAHERVDPLGLGEREVGVVVEVALARVRVVGGRLARAARRAAAATRRARGSRAGARAAAARPARSSARGRSRRPATSRQ